MKKENYKNVISKIKLPEERKEEIYNSVINKQKKRQYFKPVFITATIAFVILIGTLGTVYAEEIKTVFTNIVNSTIVKKENKEKRKVEFYSNGISEVNYDANIPETKQYDPKNPNYTYEELETELGIPFLKSDYLGLEDIHLTYVEKKKEKLAEAEFSIANYGHGENPKVRWQFSFAILTKYAEQKRLEESRFRAQGNFEQVEYYIQSLYTTAYIVKKDNTFTAIFDYCDVRYTLVVLNKQIYESLEEERRETWKYGTQLLDSLYF